MDNCNEDLSTTISIITGSLLVASEILPYINSTEGNGIIDVCIKILKKFASKRRETSDIDQSLNDSTNPGV